MILDEQADLGLHYPHMPEDHVSQMAYVQFHQSTTLRGAEETEWQSRSYSYQEARQGIVGQDT